MECFIINRSDTAGKYSNIFSLPSVFFSQESAPLQSLNNLVKVHSITKLDITPTSCEVELYDHETAGKDLQRMTYRLYNITAIDETATSGNYLLYSKRKGQQDQGVIISIDEAIHWLDNAIEFIYKSYKAQAETASI